MKKKIAILGSTGSIGRSTIDILKKDKKSFDLVLISTNNNYKEILNQVREFRVRNIVIINKNSYIYLKKKLKKKKINLFNNFETFFKKINFKIDFTMSAISGLDGLKPTLNSIENSKKIAIANKESLICGWHLINKKLKIYKTKFIPIDSEHFSIWKLIENSKNDSVNKVYITASGGPFLNYPIKKFSKITPKMAIKHPNWKMGKKISVDSSTLMNKIYEIIEARNIFNLKLSQIKAIIHPKSYIHAIVTFNNGLSKFLIHDTDMKIPISNSIYEKKNMPFNNLLLDIEKLNNLNFRSVDTKRYPAYKLLKNFSNKNSLFDTILVSANDELVDLFLNKQIKFTEIIIKLNKILKLKEFIKYKHIKPFNVDEITNLNNLVRLKTRSLCII